MLYYYCYFYYSSKQSVQNYVLRTALAAVLFKHTIAKSWFFNKDLLIKQSNTKLTLLLCYNAKHCCTFCESILLLPSYVYSNWPSTTDWQSRNKAGKYACLKYVSIHIFWVVLISKTLRIYKSHLSRMAFTQRHYDISGQQLWRRRGLCRSP